MKWAKMIMKRILYPNKKILFTIAFVSFIALIFIFVYEKTESMLAYPIYCMSAYSLTALCVTAPNMIKKSTQWIQNSSIIKCILSSKVVNRYLSDLVFRGNVSIYQGVAVNFFYMIFSAVIGICYTSVWFISMAVYYLMLGAIRIYLIISYKQRHIKDEVICYRNTALCLFLLNVPIGGIILLMIRTNSVFSYPGYVIYLSALYTFYTLIIAVRNVVKFRKIGSSILSAAKVLDFIAAMMSILGLQTAMISQFSVNGDAYRKMMNGITGGFVYAIVFVIAVYMICNSRKVKTVRKAECCDE